MDLHDAARRGDLDRLRALLADGTDVDSRDEREYTPLMWASMMGMVEAVLLLVGAGADLNATASTHSAKGVGQRHRHDDSPLGLALQAGEYTIAQYLRECGATAKGGDFLENLATGEAVPSDVSRERPLRSKRRAAFREAADSPEYRELLDDLAALCDQPPKPSRKRPGIFRLYLTRFAQLRERYARNLEYARAIRGVRWPRQRDEAAVERLQDEVRRAGFHLVFTESWSDDAWVKMLLFPTEDPYAVLEAQGSDGANYGISGVDVRDWLRKLEAAHPFVLVGCGRDFVQAKFLSVPDDIEPLAERLYAFCPDVVNQGVGSLEALATELRATGRFFLWWD